MASCVSTPCQAPDSKREQFRRYLEKAGVVDSLTKGKCCSNLSLGASQKLPVSSKANDLAEAAGLARGGKTHFVVVKFCWINDIRR